MKKYFGRISFLCVLGLISYPAFADTARMEKVVEAIGIDKDESGEGADETKQIVENLVRQGLASYPTLKERAADVGARKMDKEARVANYQPMLSVQANAAREDTKDTDTRVDSQRDAQDASLVLRQNLYRGGIDSGQVDISRQNLLIAENNEQAEKERVAFAIRKAALDYNYRSARQLIDDASYQDAFDLRKLADRKLEARQVGKIDLYATTMRESTAKASALRSKTETVRAEDELIALLGPGVERAVWQNEIRKLAGRPFSHARALPTFEGVKVLTFEEKNALALAKRSELTLSQGYRERFLPSLDLVAQLSRSNSDSRYDVDQLNDTNFHTSGTFVQLQLNWKLYDRSLDYRNKAVAEEKILAEAQSETARHRVETEIQKIKTSLRELSENLPASLEAYKASGNLYDAQRRLYETGVIGIQALIDAEAEKRLAIANWHQNVYELQLNLLIWEALQKGFLPNL